MEVDWNVVVVDRFFTTLTLFMLGILILGLTSSSFIVVHHSCCMLRLVFCFNWGHYIAMRSPEEQLLISCVLVFGRCMLALLCSCLALPH